MDDDTILAELRTGSPDAVRALYAGYGPGIFGFVFRRTGDAELSREIVQDVMTNVWRSAPRFDSGRGSFRSWIFEIARNATVDAGRRAAGRPRTVAEIAPDAAAAVSDEVESFLRQSLVRTALERLPEDHRRVVELVYFRQLSSPPRRPSSSASSPSACGPRRTGTARSPSSSPGRRSRPTRGRPSGSCRAPRARSSTSRRATCRRPAAATPSP